MLIPTEVSFDTEQCCLHQSGRFLVSLPLSADRAVTLFVTRTWNMIAKLNQAELAAGWQVT